MSAVMVLSLSGGIGPTPLAALQISLVSAGRPQSSSRSYTLVRIAATGLRRLTLAQINRLSGLKAGTLVTQRDLQAALSRLLDSGLFTSVSVRTRMEGYGLVVIFDLEEAVWSTPVVFDNFVTLTDEAIRQAIRKDVPTFEKAVPDQPRVLARIATAIEQLLRKTEPSATVSYMLVPSTTARPRYYRFTMAIPGKPIRVCGIELEGLGDDVRENVALRARTLTGSDYSRAYVEQYAAESLAAVARNNGYYQARVLSMRATRETNTEACGPGGVHVQLVFDTGPPYVWTGAQWHGATVLPTQDLLALLDYPAGRPYDADRLDRGLTAIQHSYERRGYLRAQIEFTPQADPVTHTVSYSVMIREGPRFRMGALRIEGLEPPLVEHVRTRWALAVGDFYDGAYLATFLSDTRERDRQALDGRTEITVRTTSDASTGTVDLTLQFSRPRK